MKKSILLFVTAISLLSCKKDSSLSPGTTITQPPTLPPTIPHPKQTFVVIPNYIKTSVIAGKVQTLTFTNSPVVVSITNDSAVSYKLNGKTISAVIKKILVNGISTIQVKSTAGKLYYSLDIDATGAISNLNYGVEIPFAIIDVTAQPYTQCMKAYITKCYSSLWCSVTFGSTMWIGASIGWSIGCALGYKP